MAEKENRLRDVKPNDWTMRTLWVLCMLIGLFLCGLLVYKVITYEENPVYGNFIKPCDKEVTLVPQRGDILDCNNRVLATTTVAYEVHFDTAVPEDSVWNSGIMPLCEALEEQFNEKSAAQYYEIFQKARDKKKRYVPVMKDISQLAILKVRQMPIFCLGTNGGGYIEDRSEKRLYPYGTSARRTIGYVKNNSDSTAKRIGVEGRFDKDLHGVDGIQVMKKSDYGMISVRDSKNKKAINGKSIRTTIDIDIQNIADEALRQTVEKNDLIEKSCVIIMERTTGAIKAMVNLGRDPKGRIGEWDNYALRTAEAPGSVFKGAVLMAMFEEGYLTTLETRIRTYGGDWQYNGQTFNDAKHLNYNNFPSGYIKIREAFEMSANNPFRQLICDSTTLNGTKSFANNPARFIRKVKSFGLLDTLDFDLKGCTPPFILDPSIDYRHRTKKGFWDGGTYPRIAIGYCMEISPLNIVNFYNAIANDGQMMKPYLIDAVIDGKKVVEQYKPQILHEHICTKRTADTLKRAMSMVTKTQHGTAYWQLHDAVCPIAGKTGTAQRVFKMSNGRYGMHDQATHAESQQGSFVGFFPVDNPIYTAIVVIWCKPAVKNFYGATWAAPVFKEIANKIYCLYEY